VKLDPFVAYDPFKDSSLVGAGMSSALPVSELIDPFRSIRATVNVATFNVWGLVTAKDRSTRIDAISRYFTKNPRELDILCLQEVWMADDYRTLRAALSLEFPHAHYFKSGVVGSGLAVFSKYPIREAWWKGFTLAGKANRIFDGDWYAGKGIGAVRVNHPVAGDLDIFNTHVRTEFVITC
jgi:sphingomyelin phosphodiesterase 2